MTGPCVVCRSRGGATPAPIPLCASEGCVRRLVRGVAKLASTQGRADAGDVPTRPGRWPPLPRLRDYRDADCWAGTFRAESPRLSKGSSRIERKLAVRRDA